MIKQHKTELLVSQQSIYQTFCLTNDEIILCYVQEKQLKALDMRSKAIICEISFPEELIFESTSLICISFDNKYCCASAQTRKDRGYYQLCRFNLEENIFIDYMENFHFNKLGHLSFMPQTYIVVSIGGDLCIKFLDFSSRETIFNFSQERKIISIDFIRNNKWQMFIDNQCHVQLMKCQTKRFLTQFKLRKGTFYQSKLIADGQIIILSTNRQFIYSFQKGKLIKKFTPNFNSSCAFISEMRIYYLKQKAIQVIDLQTGELREFPIELPTSFCKAFLSKISESLLIGSLNFIIFKIQGFLRFQFCFISF